MVYKVEIGEWWGVMIGVIVIVVQVRHGVSLVVLRFK